MSDNTDKDHNSYLDKLVRQLNGKKVPETLAEELYGFGSESYNYLLASLNNPESLNDYQIINILILLLNPKFWEFFLQNPSSYYDRLIGFTSSNRIRVRSKAAVILLTSLRQVERSRALQVYLHRDSVISILEESLAMGLDKSTEEWIQSFISRKN